MVPIWIKFRKILKHGLAYLGSQSIPFKMYGFRWEVSKSVRYLAVVSQFLLNQTGINANYKVFSI